MSLLMDALRHAEQGKQPVAGVDNPPKLPAREKCSDDRLPQQSLVPMMMAGEAGSSPRPSGHEILQLESGNGDAKTDSLSTNAGDTIDVLEIDEMITASGLPEVSAAVDLPLEGNIDLQVVVVPDIEVPDGEAEQASPQSGHEMVDFSDTPVVPLMVITDASAESSKQAARTVFAAKSKLQRAVRRRRLLLMGLAGFAMLGATGFLLYPYQSIMVNATPPIVASRSAAPPAEPVNVPQEAVAAESADPPADLEETSADNDGAGLSEQKITADRTASPGQSGASPSQAAPDSPQALEPVLQPEIVPVSSSSTPASSPESPSGQVLTAVAQTEPDLEQPYPLAEFQPLSRPAAITITHRAQSSQQSDSLSAAAYEAYQRGSFDQARDNFQLILQADPAHRGATLGLAAVALRRNETDLARDLYLRLLEQDPSDPLAKVGLMAIMPTHDPVGMESQLKLLIGLHPNVAPLYFALGNLYAAARRWNEAQQAYFNALQVAGKAASRPEAVSPDYLFNLAVSLEHLNQFNLAGKYYREALQRAVDHPAGFDQEALRGRLADFNRIKTQ